MKIAKNFIISFICLSILILVIVNLFHFSAGTNPVTLNSTLNFLSNSSSEYTILNINEMINLFTIGGNWGILDGFRIFLNSLGSILGVVAWVCSSVFYTLTFAIRFMFFILG